MTNINIRPRLPAIACLDREILVVDEKFCGYWKLTFTNAGTFRCMSTSKKRKKFFWFLDSDGRFFELKFKGVRRSWAECLRFLWNFVLDEYDIVASVSINTGELKAKLHAVTDRFPEASHGRDLVQVLDKKPDDEIISSAFMRDYLCEN